MSKRLLTISRDGQEIGTWPLDVAIALIRAGAILETDTYWIEGMDGGEPLGTIFPPAPSPEKSTTFAGRDKDDESYWMFYCRDGETVVGPRTQEEIGGLILSGILKPDDLLSAPGLEKWITVSEFIDETGNRDTYNNFQSAINSSHPGAPSIFEEGWVQTGLGLTQFLPNLGIGYLAFNAAKHLKLGERLSGWLDNKGSENQKPEEINNTKENQRTQIKNGKQIYYYR
jgi:hypothetical protein